MESVHCASNHLSVYKQTPLCWKNFRYDYNILVTKKEFVDKTYLPRWNRCKRCQARLQKHNKTK